MLFRKETDDETIQIAIEECATGAAILLDVRERSEWNVVRFKGATLIPTSEIKNLPRNADAVQGLEKNTKLYVHCAMGVRADKIAKRLSAMGYQVTPLKNSFEKLAESGFETEQ